MCRCGYFYFNDGYCLHGLFKIIRWPKIIKFYDKRKKTKSGKWLAGLLESTDSALAGNARRGPGKKARGVQKLDLE